MFTREAEPLGCLMTKGHSIGHSVRGTPTVFINLVYKRGQITSTQLHRDKWTNGTIGRYVLAPITLARF